MLTPEDLERRAEEDRARMRQVASNYANIIQQHDDLARGVIAACDQIDADLSALKDLDDQIMTLDKETAQRIYGLYEMDMAHNLPSMRMAISGVKKQIVINHQV